MPIKFSSTGSFSNFEAYLQKMKSGELFSSLQRFGAQGVAALRAATPVDSGVSADSWGYEIVQRGTYFSIRWKNSHMVEGVPLVIMLDNGHGTRQGGYVAGRNFIAPAIEPIFAQIEAEFTRVVRG